MSKPQTIDALFAWVATQPDGSEGLCAADMGNHWLPLIGADMDRVKSLRRWAEATREATGCRIRLVRFSKREDMEELP